MFRKVQQPSYSFGGKVGAGSRKFGSKANIRRGGGGGAMHHQALMAATGQTKSPLERS